MSQDSLLIELRDFKYYIQGKSNHIRFDALVERLSRHILRGSDAHLDELENQVRTLQSTIDQNARLGYESKIKAAADLQEVKDQNARLARESEDTAAAELLKAVNAEKKVSAVFRNKWLSVLGSVLDGRMENLSLISRDFVKFKVSADLARANSAYIDSALSIGMKNGKINEIHLDTDPTVLKLLCLFILLGPDHLDLVDINITGSRTIFELMELSTQMLIPWLCSHLAANINCSAFDVGMLTRASLQRDTCTLEIRDSWAVVYVKA